MTKFFGLRANTYSYLIDYGSEDKKTKSPENVVIKRKIKFESLKIFYLKNLSLSIIKTA